MSDTMFQSLLRSSTPRPEGESPETSFTLVPKPATKLKKSRPPPDPFSANATTYYTPGTVLPPSPPQIMHRRAASVEEDALWQLKTQLAVQMEMAAQYEVDLRARDALVSCARLPPHISTTACRTSQPVALVETESVGNVPPLAMRQGRARTWPCPWETQTTAASSICTWKTNAS